MVVRKDKSQPPDYSCSDLAVMLTEHMDTEDIRRNFELFRYALSVMEEVSIDQLRAQLHSGQQVFRYYIGTEFVIDQPEARDVFMYDKLFYSDGVQTKYRLWTGYRIDRTARSYFDNKDLDLVFIKVSGQPYGEYYRYKRILERSLCDKTEEEIQRAREMIYHDWYFITFAGKFDLMYYLWKNVDTIAKRKPSFPT